MAACAAWAATAAAAAECRLLGRLKWEKKIIFNIFVYFNAVFFVRTIIHFSKKKLQYRNNS